MHTTEKSVVPEVSGANIVTATPASTDESSTSQERRSIAIGYLRTFITLLVVAHHSVLAYLQFAPPSAPASLAAEPRWWQVFPIIDSQRWGGFTFLLAFNDIFFMSLMFFLSGLFVWPSLKRKGSGTFLRDRGIRLGGPFIVAAFALAPLAYYPTYLTTTATPAFKDFWWQWLSLGSWPAGPAWFVWVLLSFDAIAAAAFAIRPALRVPAGGNMPARILSRMGKHPLACFGLLVGVSTVAYVPLLQAFGPMAWISYGPFAVQTSRVLHYTLYFGVGMAAGASHVGRGLLSPDGRLARRWLMWAGVALVSFIAALAIMTVAMTRPGQPWVFLSGFAFALSCAATSFGLLAVFLRYSRKRVPVLESLRGNAYGIYLVHYAAVTWLQYSLLTAALPGLAKGTLVLLGSTLVSWLLVASVRRIRAVESMI